ncbi:signal peptidase I [Virgibacillus soli]|uniref:signal peptidase I n=1 Tax=Paracerasibacillus soli TaxID=480284 RepID=UPI0035EF8289
MSQSNIAFRKIFIYSLRLIFIILLAFVLFIVLQMIRHPGQPPSFLGYQPYTVVSNSMKPTFETGDLVIVKMLEAKDITVHDVITFQDSEGRFVTHRVVDISQEDGSPVMKTKGDNNNVVDDDIVTSDALIGRQAFLIKNGGFIARFASSSLGFMLLIIVPLIGYVSLTLYERIFKSNQVKKSST